MLTAPQNMNIVKEWRHKYGFTQEQGAAILDVPRHTLARWELKKNNDIPPEFFYIFCVLVGGKYYDHCHQQQVSIAAE